MSEPIANDFMKMPGRWGGPNTGAPRTPMSPEQLEALHPKSVTVQQPILTPENEAAFIARRCGIHELTPAILRLIKLERIVAEMTTTIAALQSTVLALKHSK